MQLKLATLAVAAACLASICPRGPHDTVVPVLSSARVYYDDAPVFPDSSRQIIRDHAYWQGIWARAISTQPSPPPQPEIDFSKEMVILVAAGKMRPGDGIRVDSAGVREGLYVVVVRTVVECQNFPADAYPFELVRVRREVAPVVWVERREQAAHCR
jgi:hypothetical protein